MLIGQASDKSNITLDPDTDSYFVGDVLVNQAASVLQQTQALLVAAGAPNQAQSNVQKIAFAEARDGLAATAAALRSDLDKAIAGNADGSVQSKLAGPTRTLTNSLAKLVDTAKMQDRANLANAAADVEQALQALLPQANDEMERLLNARIDGYHGVIYSRLSIALISLVLSCVIGWWVIGTVTGPLKEITALMAELTSGKLDITLPQDTRADEVGGLILALRAFHRAAVEREQARRAEEERVQAEQTRAQRVEASIVEFEQMVATVLDVVSSSATQLEATAQSMVTTAEQTSQQSTAVAAASEQAAANVQSVSSATEELSASIREIGQRVAESSRIANLGAVEANDTNARVQRLKDSVVKIDTVVGLINEIADQTNLLALNATIEAARAGEAGKGFAVVAAEVKALATQTTKATEDIAAQINGVQSETEHSVQAISAVTQRIEEMNGIAAGIAAAVEEQGSATQEIARSVAQVAEGTAMVTTNIASVSEASHHTGAAATQVLGAARELSRNGETLRTQVVRFLTEVRAA